MSDQINQEDVLNLSDDDFVNLPEPEDYSFVEGELETPETDVNNDPETDQDPEEPETDNEPEENNEDPENESEEKSSKENLEDFAPQDKTEETKEEKSEKTEEVSLDLMKEVYNKVFAPFRANGKEIQVKSVDDVISLMQMGANYNKKMASIKGYMPVLKMLQKHELLSEEDLSYLIDLKRKDPKAIAKLLQDSEIDLYNFDTEQANDYKPGNYAVSPQEIALDEALQEIQHSPQYTRTVTVLGQQWDEDSRTKVAQNPQVIGVINQHMEAGLFDFVWQEVERQRVMGYLQGVSDLDAYYQVGEALNQAGHLRNPNQHVQEQQNRQVQQQAVKQKKAAAAPTSKASTQPSLSKVDILNMSDEEFEKLGASHLM